MKTLYFDVTAGAAGDMLMGALYELCPEKEAFLQTMNALDLPGVSVRPEPVSDRGVDGVHMAVAFGGADEAHVHDPAHGRHPHAHRSLAGVLERIRGFPLPAPVLDDACAVYALIAAAEARAHKEPVAEIHFHEVGMNDAIADIVGVCLLIRQLAPERIGATPISTGSGQVRCAHGVLPVPAPATAFLLEGLPTQPGAVEAELCTPTGAALLRHFAQEFGPLPAMADAACGRGMGSRRFAQQVNAVTAFLGEVR